MKLHDYLEIGIVYIELRETPRSETREAADSINLNLDANGNAVGIDIDHASSRRLRRPHCRCGI